MQRFGSLVNLNCHFRSVLPVGVFTEKKSRDVVFRPTPPPAKPDTQTLIKQVVRGTEKFIGKRAIRDFNDECPGFLAQEQSKDLSENGSRGGSRLHSAEHATRRQAFFYGYFLHLNVSSTPMTAMA